MRVQTFVFPGGFVRPATVTVTVGGDAPSFVLVTGVGEGFVTPIFVRIRTACAQRGLDPLPLGVRVQVDSARDLRETEFGLDLPIAAALLAVRGLIWPPDVPVYGRFDFGPCDVRLSPAEAARLPVETITTLGDLLARYGVAPGVSHA